MTSNINISEKYAKVNESFTVTTCDNGFLVDLGGQDAKDEWVDRKILISSLTDLKSVVEQIVQMPRR